MKQPTTMMGRFDALDRALVKAGFPATSTWWRRTLRLLYAGTRRQLVARVGRRGGKSSTLCRIAVCEALYGGHNIPPGDVGVVAFVSTTRDEAAQRLRTISAILAVLNVKHVPIENGIELEGRPIVFKTFVATIAGVSGFTAVAAICDEVSKWRDADSGANPAREVLASLRPTLATQKSARIFLSSSPLGIEDAHAAAFDVGDDEYQLTAYAPTWVANPTVSEADTRALERDERVWQREYAALAQAGAESAFDADAIDRAIGNEQVDVAKAGHPILVLDPSSGKSDAFTWCLAQHIETAAGVQFFRLSAVGAVEGKFWNQISGDEIIARLGALCKEHKIQDVHGDQHDAFMITGAFKKLGIRYHEHDWTNQNKIAAVERVRRWLADGQLILPNHDKMRRELIGLKEKIVNGSVTFAARGSRHDDFAALLITAAMADIERGVKSVEASQEDPAAWARHGRAIADARAQIERQGPGPWSIVMEGGGAVGYDGGLDFRSAGYEGIGDEPGLGGSGSIATHNLQLQSQVQNLVAGMIRR